MIYEALKQYCESMHIGSDSVLQSVILQCPMLSCIPLPVARVHISPGMADETPWAITRTAIMLPTNFAVSRWHDVRRPGDGVQSHGSRVGARQSYNVIYFT